MLTPELLEPKPDTDLRSATKDPAAVLGFHEPCFHGAGHDPTKLTGNLHFGRDIRPFADVTSLEDYWQIRECVNGPQRTEADGRPFSRRQPEVVLPPPLFAAPAPAVKPSELGPMETSCLLLPAQRASGGRAVRGRLLQRRSPTTTQSAAPCRAVDARRDGPGASSQRETVEGLVMDDQIFLIIVACQANRCRTASPS